MSRLCTGDVISGVMWDIYGILYGILYDILYGMLYMVCPTLSKSVQRYKKYLEHANFCAQEVEFSE